MNRKLITLHLEDFFDVFKRNREALLWFCGSLMPLVLFFSGALNTKLPLIDSADLSKMQGIVQGSVYANIETDENAIISICNVYDSSFSNVCGASYRLSDSISSGIDLSRYQKLNFSVSAISPNTTQSVRLQLKNFNPNYSVATDPISLKHLGVTIDASAKEQQYSIELDDFQVESWWLFRYQIGMKDSAAEYNNVPELVIINNGVTKPGEYRIVLRSLYAVGQLVSLGTIVMLTMSIWLCLMIFGLLRYDRAIKNKLHTDMLTRIQNRSGLVAFLRAHAKCYKHQPNLGLVYIDLDNFKSINDNYGHEAGDKVLKTFAERTSRLLEDHLPDETRYCFVRMSGDEFALLVATGQQSIIDKIAAKLHQSFDEPLSLSGHEINLSFSVGVAFEEVFDHRATELFAHADAAMYVAKASGKSTISSYDSDLHHSQQHLDSELQKFSKAFIQDKRCWQFVPLVHLGKKTLDTVEVHLSAAHGNASALLIESIPTRIHQKQAAEKLTILIFSEFEKFYQQHASWFFEHKINAVFSYPDMLPYDGVFSPLTAEQLCKSNIHNPFLMIGCNASQGEVCWQHLIDAQHESDTSHVQLALTNFMCKYADLGLFDRFAVNMVQYYDDYINQHLEKGAFDERFVNFNKYLKSFNVSIACDGYASDLNTMRALEEVGVDYVKGFLLEPSSSMSEIKRLHKISIRNTLTKAD